MNFELGKIYSYKLNNLVEIIKIIEIKNDFLGIYYYYDILYSNREDRIGKLSYFRSGTYIDTYSRPLDKLGKLIYE